jgi:hypothetical protein
MKLRIVSDIDCVYYDKLDTIRHDDKLVCLSDECEIYFNLWSLNNPLTDDDIIYHALICAQKYECQVRKLRYP